eukprot:5941928-Amphidinium_carterae.2
MSKSSNGKWTPTAQAFPLPGPAWLRLWTTCATNPGKTCLQSTQQCGLAIAHADAVGRPSKHLCRHSGLSYQEQGERGGSL